MLKTQLYKRGSRPHGHTCHAGAGRQQRMHNGHVPRLGGQVQRRHLIRRRRLLVSSSSKQAAHQGGAALEGCPMQGGIALLVGSIQPPGCCCAGRLSCLASTGALPCCCRVRRRSLPPLLSSCRLWPSSQQLLNQQPSCALLPMNDGGVQRRAPQAAPIGAAEAGGASRLQQCCQHFGVAPASRLVQQVLLHHKSAGMPLTWDAHWLV